MSRVDVSFATVLTSKPMSGYEFCNGKKENILLRKSLEKKEKKVQQKRQNRRTHRKFNYELWILCVCVIFLVKVIRHLMS